MVPASASELILIKHDLLGNFTQISNEIIRNPAINWKALGLLVYLLSLPPKKWYISLQRLCEQKLDGEASVRSAMKQLESAGYLKVIRKRGASGRFVRGYWLVTDQPIMDWAPHLGKSNVGEQAMVQPAMEEQASTNTGFVEIQKDSITTTTPDTSGGLSSANEVDSEETWSWLCHKLAVDPEKIQQECHKLKLKQSIAIDVLAEAYACKRQGSIRKSPHQFISSLFRTAAMGAFRLSAGTNIRKELPEILRQQRERSVATKNNQEVTAKNAPTKSALAQKHLVEIRKMVGPGERTTDLIRKKND
ncbi:hypothetical protein D3C81_239370 [compost metagenome]